MKYTLKTFFKALIGTDLKEVERRENNGNLYFRWDGSYGILYTKPKEELTWNSYEVDEINLTKSKPNIFCMDLHYKNYWYFTVEFSDGGPRRNKEYKLSDYIK